MSSDEPWRLLDCVRGQYVAQPLKAGDRLYCDGKEVSLCDSQWNKIRTVYSGKIPVWNVGANRVTVKSEFSGNRAPTLMFELKSTGEGAKARRGRSREGWKARRLVLLVPRPAEFAIDYVELKFRQRRV